MTEYLKDISQTVSGYPVRSLKWNQLDNIIVGQVKHPDFGREHIHDGYITVQWNKHGKPLNRYKGDKDLIIMFF